MLRHLMCILHKISRTSEKNSMDSKNLSVCIAQTLLRPPEKMPAEEIDYKRTSQLIQHLIDNAPELWDHDDCVRLFTHLSMTASSLMSLSSDSDSLRSGRATNDNCKQIIKLLVIEFSQILFLRTSLHSTFLMLAFFILFSINPKTADFRNIFLVCICKSTKHFRLSNFNQFLAGFDPHLSRSNAWIFNVCCNFKTVAPRIMNICIDMRSNNGTYYVNFQPDD